MSSASLLSRQPAAQAWLVGPRYWWGRGSRTPTDTQVPDARVLYNKGAVLAYDLHVPTRFKPSLDYLKHLLTQSQCCVKCQ